MLAGGHNVPLRKPLTDLKRPQVGITTSLEPDLAIKTRYFPGASRYGQRLPWLWHGCVPFPSGRQD